MTGRYTEPYFTVSQQAQFKNGKKTIRLQVRAEPVDMSFERLKNAFDSVFQQSDRHLRLPTYIAIESWNAQGQPLDDILLLYPKHRSTGLMTDWHKLLLNQGRLNDELTGWDEKIVDHSTGYCRNGAVYSY